LKEKSEAKTDFELVEAAFGGDLSSFGLLCERYYVPIVAIAHSRVGDKDLAEDIAQETFVKACLKLKELKDKRKFAAWLAVICRNICVDVTRKNRNYIAENPPVKAAYQDVEDFEDEERVKQVISQLPEKLREIIYLKFYEGLSYEKITKILGISSHAIHGRLKRAKRIIAGKLGGRQ
jgi:RNA polymerase sigma-70 factor (ECF subfamily)